MAKTPSREELFRAATLAAVRTKGPKCSACSLDEEVMGLVMEMRATMPATSFNAISKGLNKIQIVIAPGILSRHFRDHVEAK